MLIDKFIKKAVQSMNDVKDQILSCYDRLPANMEV